MEKIIIYTYGVPGLNKQDVEQYLESVGIVACFMGETSPTNMGTFRDNSVIVLTTKAGLGELLFDGIGYNFKFGYSVAIAVVDVLGKTKYFDSYRGVRAFASGTLYSKKEGIVENAIKSLMHKDWWSSFIKQEAYCGEKVGTRQSG